MYATFPAGDAASGGELKATHKEWEFATSGCIGLLDALILGQNPSGTLVNP